MKVIEKWVIFWVQNEFLIGYGVNFNNLSLDKAIPLKLFRVKGSVSPTSNHSKSVNYFTGRKGTIIFYRF